MPWMYLPDDAYDTLFRLAKDKLWVFETLAAPLVPFIRDAEAELARREPKGIEDADDALDLR